MLSLNSSKIYSDVRRLQYHSPGKDDQRVKKFQKGRLGEVSTFTERTRGRHITVKEGDKESIVLRGCIPMKLLLGILL